MTANSASGDNADYNGVDFQLYYEQVAASAAGLVRIATDQDDGYGKK